MTLTLKTKDNETILASDSLSHLLENWNEEIKSDSDEKPSLEVDECFCSIGSKKFICPLIGWNFIKGFVVIISPTNFLPSFFEVAEGSTIFFFGKEKKVLSTESIKEDNEWKVTVHFER